METEKRRRPGLLFTRPDKLQLFDHGYIVAQELGARLISVTKAASSELEFIEWLTLAKCFARNHANEMVFVKFTMVPRVGTCAKVESHLECME